MITLIVVDKMNLAIRQPNDSSNLMLPGRIRIWSEYFMLGVLQQGREAKKIKIDPGLRWGN